MNKKSGQEKLLEFTERSYQERITQVTDKVWHVLGVGHSNAVFIEAESSVILIDTLDSLERGKRLLDIIKRETKKEVRTILYTHGHPDHRGGAGAFMGSAPEIIAFAPKTPPLARTQMLRDIQNLRGARQFGYALTDEENISQGIGIREGVAYGEKPAFVPPDTVYQEDRVERTIDGVRLELVRLPGETEDQMAVWLPEKAVLCCGDNYYGCWPNLYAIRGSQYRDITAWLQSLETLKAYPARYLLPGHTAPLTGQEQIREVLGNFIGAIDYVLTQTLAGMNEGKSEDRLAAEIKLPKEYAQLPYLGEFYGCVDWTVRAIFTAYLGWFDGNPTNLHPLSEKERAGKTISLMGGPQAVEKAIEEAMRDGEYQWCLELCDLLTADGKETDGVRGRKAEALRKRAEEETSANGRHYYLAIARELENGEG